MQHFNFETLDRKKEIFFKEPESFTKFTDKETLSFALGATLYMPALREDIAKNIIDRKYPGLTSIVIDLEDSVADNQLAKAEQKLCIHMETIYKAIEEREISLEDLPLIFIRVRDPKQMKYVVNKLKYLQCILTGYVFPKFSIETGKKFLEILKRNTMEYDLMLYGMPIFESAEIIHKETRMNTLLEIKKLLDIYEEYILNIRIGATDLCGLYGIRRKVDTTVYDISVIRDCLTDIINVFNRKEGGYVISGAVWEFFSKDQWALKPQLNTLSFQQRYDNTELKSRRESINQYIDGLVNEVILDKLNGVTGKTIIHPTQIRPIHSLYVVTHEEYIDAVNIMKGCASGIGVVKSIYENKMNEMKPHFYWAKRILLRAKVFGVFNENHDFTSLIMDNEPEKVLLEVR